MSCEVVGLGTALPAHAISQEDAFVHGCKFAELNERQTRLLNTIYRRSNVRQRYSVLLKQPNDDGGFYPTARDAHDMGPTTQQRMQRYAAEIVPLALQACHTSLQNSELNPRDITHLVTVSCTGFMSPGLDAALIEQLNLPRWVGRTNIGFMGCHGAINGLRVALGFANADAHAKILLCAAELCTLHFHYGWNPDAAVANALFADGAAAMVGQYQNDSQPQNWSIADCSSFLIPDSAADMTWTIGNNGFRMTLSDRVPDLIQEHLADWMAHWLQSHNLKISDIASWIIHPGGPSIINAVAASLNLTDTSVAASRQVLAEHGNMSSPTVFFILDRLRKQQAAKPCVMVAFGPGLVAETALLL